MIFLLNVRSCVRLHDPPEVLGEILNAFSDRSSMDDKGVRDGITLILGGGRGGSSRLVLFDCSSSSFPHFVLIINS